jgi:hypothetical protein
MIVVSDTSAITALLQIDQIELLARIYHEVFIPHAVQRELLVTHLHLPKFIQSRQIANQPDFVRLAAELDEGEAEAIILAKELKADDLLMDETLGRRVAMREGVHVIGLLGVLLEAKARGYVPGLRNLIRDLETKAHFHISPELKHAILREVGEL